MLPHPSLEAYRLKIRRERIILTASVILVAAAWIYGFVSNGTDVAALVPKVIPNAAYVVEEARKSFREAMEAY